MGDLFGCPGFLFKLGATRGVSTRVHATVQEKIPRGGTHPNRNYCSPSGPVGSILTDTKEGIC